MPPSAGACQTTDAALNPDCGRALEWSSIITAIARFAATAGVTGRPVSGAATVGVGTGVGRNVGVGEGVTCGVAGAGVGPPAIGGWLPLGWAFPGEVPVAARIPSVAPAPRARTTRIAASVRLTGAVDDGWSPGGRAT